MQKQELDLEQKLVEASEGNPGCLSVLAPFLEGIPEIIEFVYRYGPRGSDVWILWRDWCGQDLETFSRVIGVMMKKRAPELHQGLTARVEAREFFAAWEHYDQ